MKTLNSRKNQYGKILSREQLKSVTGGTLPIDGQCVLLQTDSGMASCWYTTSTPDELFHRVYPDQEGYAWENVDCVEHNCTMN